MDTFAILEDKIKMLVDHIKKLQSEKDMLQQDFNAVSAKTEELVLENAKLTEENSELRIHIKEAQKSHAKGNKELEVLSKERELTKVAVDDLIKSIDILVGAERPHSNEV